MAMAGRAGRGRIYQTITETIGDTPIVKLGRLTKQKGVGANLLAKLEFFNPLASVKDRDRKSTRLNSSHIPLSRMPSSA